MISDLLSDCISQEVRTVDDASGWLIANLGTVIIAVRHGVLVFQASGLIEILS